MSYLDDDFHSVKQDQELYAQDYESQSYFFSRKLLLTHALSYLVDIKKQINIQTESNRNITLQNLKQIRKEDKSQELGSRFAYNFIKLLSLKKQGQKISKNDILQLILISFKEQFIVLLVLYGLGVIVQLFQLLSMFYIYKSVAKFKIKSAFIYASIYVTFLYIFHCVWHNANMKSNMLVSKIKSSLVSIQYAKISKMTSYSINQMDKGMIINLITSALGECQQNLPYIFYSLMFPINIIGYTVILVKLLGWPGLVGIALTIIFVPILIKLSQVNSSLFQQISKEKDKRVNLTTQTIEGMKFIKLYCWENVFQKQIDKHREAQMSLLRSYALSLSIQRALGNSIGILTSLVIYLLSFQYNTGLSLPKIFSTFQAMTILSFSFLSVTLAFSFWSQMTVVFQRFAIFLNYQNTQMLKIDVSDFFEFQINKKVSFTQKQLQKGQIIFENFNAFWNQDFNYPTLTNINLKFQKGKLYGITGSVGSGKSTVLAAILSEVPYYSGIIQQKGSIAYVEQQPIIFSDTVRNNITFGAVFQQKRYEKALQLSCLVNDISIFGKGDQTVVGEKGTTLSGGQRARLSFARALYTDADIFLLDDPISAVDSKVAKCIHQNIVHYLANQKTVVLVTHQINYLYDCDQVIILNQGEITAKGKPSEISNILNQLDVSKDNLIQKINTQKKLNSNTQLVSDSFFPIKNKRTYKYLQTKNEQYFEDFNIYNRFSENHINTNVKTYTDFFSSNKMNYVLLPLTILLFISSQVILTFYYRILSTYENVRQGKSFKFGNDFNLFWTLNILLVFAYLIALILKYFCLNICLLNSSQKIHQIMVKSVIRSPMKFFDLTPSGTLINKFTNDLGVIQNNLIYSLLVFVQGLISIIAALINICQLDLSLIVFMVPLVIGVVWFFQYSRQVLLFCKQLYLQNKSELVHFFRQNMAGMTQIRILGRRKNQIKELSAVLNKELKASFGHQITSRGFSFYISLTTIVFIGITLIYLISYLTPDKVSSFGLCVVYLTFISENTDWSLKNIIVTDGLMISAQRILDFSKLDSEVDLQEDLSIVQQEQQKTKSVSFLSSKIQFKNYSARYRDGLPLVLQNLSVQMQQGQRIGLVGRTGAGKSSIVQALFRILQPQIGSAYKIGENDSFKMKLHSLRKQFSIIPQSPFIFKGSIRYNIDPQGLVSDQKIWHALDKVDMTECIKSLPNQLQTEISSSSESFSMGQKQLLSLARVLIYPKKFLVLDEATSNVDIKTDAFIQQVIREEFKNNTTISIAHRLNTVADYDKILVMQEGKLIQEGSYNNLISKKGTFYQMAKNFRRNMQQKP